MPNSVLQQHCTHEGLRPNRRDETVVRGMKKSEATYLFGVSISSVKRYVRAWSIPSLAQGKHD